jgi:hypothetical protein
MIILPNMRDIDIDLSIPMYRVEIGVYTLYKVSSEHRDFYRNFNRANMLGTFISTNSIAWISCVIRCEAGAMQVNL